MLMTLHICCLLCKGWHHVNKVIATCSCLCKSCPQYCICRHCMCNAPQQHVILHCLQASQDSQTRLCRATKRDSKEHPAVQNSKTDIHYSTSKLQSRQQIVVLNRALQMDEMVGFPESGMSLPIKIGRIDIPAVLQEASTSLHHQGRIGFYCGGANVCYAMLCSALQCCAVQCCAVQSLPA